MLLKERTSGELVETLVDAELLDPNLTLITGRYDAGDDLPDPRMFSKSNLVFRSGEALPRCWTDPDYAGRETA